MIFSELFEDFTNLKLRWKILSVIGIISSVIVIILIVILILLFKTDLLQVDELDSSDIDLKKYDELFDGPTTSTSTTTSTTSTSTSEDVDVDVVDVGPEVSEVLEVNTDLLKIKIHQDL